MKLAQRIGNITPSRTLAIDTRARELASKGVDVVNFGVGEPDFDTPEHIKEAAITALRQGFTKYTDTSGIRELKEAIRNKLLRDNGLEYGLNQIIVTVGGKQALYNAFMALCQEGDEVLIPTPYWVSYPEQVKLAGATPVYLTTDEKTGFKVTPPQLEGAITPRTKVFLLNSPSNPSGAVYTREELEGLAEVCVKHGLYVISDEIYEKLVYDGQKHISIASLGPEIKRLTVVINGMSKAYAMTGWRMGYAAAEPEIIKAMTAVQGHSTSNPTSIVQKASVAALEGPQEPVFKMVAEYNKRRDYVVERLNRLRGFLTPVPPGAFYVFPNVAELFGQKVGNTVIRDGDHLAEVLLNEAGVAVVPGSAFGAPANLRFSYATSMERIKEGLDRLERLLNG